MLNLPQLIEEDILCFHSALDELLAKTDATAGLLIDKGGPLIAVRGQARELNCITIAALAAGCFTSTQAIAGLLGETTFTSVYQQGERHSLLIENIDENLLLLVIFRASLSAGAVKYFARRTIKKVADQLQLAWKRSPDASMDLVSLNLIDTASVFRKKE
jgi:predicted regulator of Ras-like GTPase activity (Roadblock/LC7/MglB family)